MTSTDDFNSQFPSNYASVLESSEVLNFEYKNFNNSNLIIKLTSTDGRILKEFNNYQDKGTYLITADFSGLSSAIYFIHIISGNSTITRKVLLCMNTTLNNFERNSIQVSKLTTNELKFIYEYSFIGFKKDFMPDTINIHEPEDRSTYTFHLKPSDPLPPVPFTNWKVRKCSVEIVSKAVVYAITKSKSGPGENVGEKWDSLLKYNCNFKNFKGKFNYCDTTNIGDSIVINYCTYNF